MAEIKYLTQDEIFNQIASKEAFDLLEKKRHEIEVKIGELEQVKALLTHKINLVQHGAVRTNKEEA